MGIGIFCVYVTEVREHPDFLGKDSGSKLIPSVSSLKLIVE